MQRRGFLLSIGLFIAALIGGSRWLFGNRFQRNVAISYAELPEDVQVLSRQGFINAFPDLSVQDLIRKLYDRGVYNTDGFHINRIRDNAVNDPLIEFGKTAYARGSGGTRCCP